jgi:hypothetical protein
MLSNVKCQMSNVKCQMSNVKFVIFVKATILILWSYRLLSLSQSNLILFQWICKRQSEIFVLFEVRCGSICCFGLSQSQFFGNIPQWKIVNEIISEFLPKKFPFNFFHYYTIISDAFFIQLNYYDELSRYKTRILICKISTIAVSSRLPSNW